MNVRRTVIVVSAAVLAVDLDLAVQQIHDVRSWWTVALLVFLGVGALLAAAELFVELAPTPAGSPPGRLHRFIVGACAVMSISGLGSVLFVHVDPPAVTLVMSTFGEPFGSDLAARYQAEHPGVRLDIRPQPYIGYSQAVHDQLANASPQADVVVMQKSYFALYGANANDFVDLNDRAATDRWSTLTRADLSTEDGTKLLGLPLDLDGMAVCYRKDLFEQAGLPTDPAAVAVEFTSWPSYLALGARFHAATPGVAWVDSGAHLLNGILATSARPLQAPNGRLSTAGLETVHEAWQMTTAAVQQLGSARANTDQALETALRKGKFATMPCPSWAIGRVERLTSGPAEWGVVAPPGRIGNWGGTFVAVPKSRGQVAEAERLAVWLTEPAQQEITFNQLRIYPALKATPAEVLLYRSEVFGDARVGQIIHDSLQGVDRFPDADLNEVIANACIGPIATVERGAPPDTRWGAARRAIAAALDV